MNITVFVSGLIIFGISWVCWNAVVYLVEVYRRIKS